MDEQPGAKIKFVYWFAYYNLYSPSVRYRGLYPLEFLKTNHNISSYFVTPGYSPVNIIRFLRAYLSALLFRKNSSIIVVQKVNSNFVYANLLKFLVRVRNRNTFYDLDDADYLEHPPQTIYHFIKNCSSIFVGSQELKKNLLQYNKNIILNTSPTPDLNIIKKNKNKILTIGWIGGYRGGHKKSMQTRFFPALQDLPFKIRFVILGVCDRHEYDFLINWFKDHSKVELILPQNIDWTNENAIQEIIATFDIGIATLLDDELHRSKSAFKMKQYFNNAVPVLSSHIAENNHFLEEGKNGFFCSTPEDFKRRIIEIEQMNNSEYLKLSQHARESIRNFNLESYCETLCALCS